MKPAKTELVVHIAFVFEMNYSYSFCVDHSNLIAIAKGDSISISFMEEFLELRATKLVFLTLNAIIGYWNLKVGDCNKKSRFHTPL